MDLRCKKRGYGLLTSQEVTEQSSNVGISIAIQETFGANPQKWDIETILKNWPILTSLMILAS